MQLSRVVRRQKWSNSDCSIACYFLCVFCRNCSYLVYTLLDITSSSILSKSIIMAGLDVYISMHYYILTFRQSLCISIPRIYVIWYNIFIYLSKSKRLVGLDVDISMHYYTVILGQLHLPQLCDDYIGIMASNAHNALTILCFLFLLFIILPWCFGRHNGFM